MANAQYARDKREFVDRINSAQEWLIGAHAFLDESEAIIIDLWKGIPPRNFVVVECSDETLADYMAKVRKYEKDDHKRIDFEWDIDRALDDLDLRTYNQPVIRFWEPAKVWYLAEATSDAGTLPEPLPQPLQPPSMEATFYSPDELQKENHGPSHRIRQ